MELQELQDRRVAVVQLVSCLFILFCFVLFWFVFFWFDLVGCQEPAVRLDRLEPLA